MSVTLLKAYGGTGGTRFCATMHRVQVFSAWNSGRGGLDREVDCSLFALVKLRDGYAVALKQCSS